MIRTLSSIVALALLSSWLAGPAQAGPLSKVRGRVASVRHKFAPKARRHFVRKAGVKAPCKCGPSCGCK